jgi:hypothetical protein
MKRVYFVAEEDKEQRNKTEFERIVGRGQPNQELQENQKQGHC